MTLKWLALNFHIFSILDLRGIENIEICGSFIFSNVNKLVDNACDVLGFLI